MTPDGPGHDSKERKGTAERILVGELMRSTRAQSAQVRCKPTVLARLGGIVIEIITGHLIKLKIHVLGLPPALVKSRLIPQAMLKHLEVGSISKSLLVAGCIDILWFQVVLY